MHRPHRQKVAPLGTESSPPPPPPPRWPYAAGADSFQSLLLPLSLVRRASTKDCTEKVWNLRPRWVVTCLKPSVRLSLSFRPGSLPGTFSSPALCPSDPSPHVLREAGGTAEGLGLWWVRAGSRGPPKGKLVLIRGRAGAAGGARRHPGVPGWPGRGPALSSLCREK